MNVNSGGPRAMTVLLAQATGPLGRVVRRMTPRLGPTRAARLLLQFAALALGLFGGAQAAITYVAGNTAGGPNNVNTITISAPAGLTTGDVLLAVVAQNANVQPISVSSVPTGWALVRSVNDASTVGMAIYRKVATASEPANYTWNFGQSKRTAAGIEAFRGVDTTTLVETSAGQSNAASTSYTAPSVTTSSANDMLVTFYAAPDGNGSVSTTTGMSNQAFSFGTGAGANGVVIGSSFNTQAAAGASGAKVSAANSSLVNLGALLALKPATAAAVNHYELSLASASLACLPTTVTVTACADNSSPCSNKATSISGTTAALAASAGSLTASPISFNASGVASTTLNYPLAVDGTAVTVTLSGEQTAATNPRQCCPNGVNCVAGNSCATTFNTAGFLFSGGAGGAEATVANQTASVAFGPYWLRAVKTNTATQACEAALSSPQPVTFNYQCVDPAACSAGNRLSVGASAVASTGTSLNLAFDANGNASLGNLSFSDVGKISVNASATVAGATLSGSMKGAAGTNFVVKPFDFLVVPCNTGTPCVAAPADPGIAGGGAVFATAGLTFGATITARASGGAVTPNFGAGTTNGVESVLLSQTLKGPAAGNAGALGGTSLIPRSSFASGVASVNDLTWSEVGVITLTGTNSSFIGNALSTTGTSGNIGRFVPDHFDTVVTQGCSAGAYTYSGQALTLQISAMTGAGTPALTQNYTGASGFAKAHTLTEPNAVAGSFGATAAVPASAFASGVATISTPVFTFTSATRQTTPSLIKVRTSDADAVSSLRAVAASSVEGTSTVRGGRVRILNAYGSEKLDLPMTLRAQYWNGTGWVQNTEDNCTGDTTLGAANAVSLALAGAAATCVQDTGSPGRSGAGCVAAGPLAPTNEQFRSGTSMVVGPSTLLKGDFNLWLQKTGVTTAAPQWTTVTVSVPSWLQYPWIGVVNSNPAGRATFGVYKSTLIYRRENY